MQLPVACISFVSVVRFNPHPSRRTGATKLRSWQRLQEGGFQSSPVPEDGCNSQAIIAAARALVFPSSPVPEDGCNSVCFPRGVPTAISFNPHPSRRTGATRPPPSVLLGLEMFQSSPVPEDGCNRSTHLHILRRPSFNPHPSRRTGATSHSGEHCSTVASRFNPHPSRRTGATRPSVTPTG